MTKTPILVFAGFVAFLFIIAYVFATAIMKPAVAEGFAPTPIAPQAVPDTAFEVTLTVDARDENDWVFVDLGRQSVVVPPDTAGWDLLVRRFDVIPAGAAINLGPVSFDSTLQLPAAGYVASNFVRDTTNDAMTRWYNYSFTSHLLEPRGDVYALLTRDGYYAKLEFIGYYCPDVAAGCVTFRYAYQPSGAPSFEP